MQEKFMPSLKFQSKFKGKNVLLTGASGSIGTQVAKKLLKSGVNKLVLCVRDEDALDPKVRDLCD